MKVFLLFVVFAVPFTIVKANDIIRFLQSRRDRDGSSETEEAKKLEAESAEEFNKPGEALIQPTADTLKSANQYPKDKDNKAVYGNMDNLGITYGKTPLRVQYSGFRKSNIMEILLDVLEKLERNKRRKRKDPELVIIELSNDQNSERNHHLGSLFETRRSKSKRNNRDRDKYSSSSDSDSSSSSSEGDYDKNPGNPYTVFKDKYKQNWLWNHYMDGDHMNINPYAPAFKLERPPAASLFFGRKWWYFNQDDYRPLN